MQGSNSRQPHTLKPILDPDRSPKQSYESSKKDAQEPTSDP